MFTQIIINTFFILTILFELKRVFSSTKHIFTNERAHLKFDIIETLKCVKH